MANLNPTVIFLIDNSASMNQQCYMGTSLLDVAKSAVETFIKQRVNQGNRSDKYLLVTLGDKKTAILSSWKDSTNHTVVAAKLKAITADGLTTIGAALKVVFDLLNRNRMVTNIDTYGQGRNPYFLEPALVLCITDGCKLSTVSQIHDDLLLPMTDSLPGSELTKEPFRWDYRLFALVLRLPANPTQEPEHLRSVPNDSSPINLMCEVTGGRSYCIRTHKTLLQCLESVSGKLNKGVIVHFQRAETIRKVTDQSGVVVHDPCTDPARAEHTSHKHDDPWHSLHRMIYIKNYKNGVPFGHWPLPEAYCPDPTAMVLTPRTAHPILKYVQEDCEPYLVQTYPYDKYELEPSPLTQILLEKKKTSICWPVYVQNSGRQSGANHLCGYLKASTNLTSVNLFVMPYNYPKLLPLIEEFINKKFKVGMEWRRSFDEYLRGVPPYYIGPLRKAFKYLGAPPNLISEQFDVGLNTFITDYLKKLKEQTRNLPEDQVVNDQQSKANGILVPNPSGSSVQNHFKKSLLASGGDVKNNHEDFLRIGEPNGTKQTLPNSFHNPFVIPPSKLISKLTKMNLNLKQFLHSTFMQGSEMMGSVRFSSLRIRLQDRKELHNQPISQMGNYQEYTRNLTKPLRDALACLDNAKRTHTFGNPFKKAKEKGMMVDETEDYDNHSPSGTASSQVKRKNTGSSSQAPPKRRKTMPGLPRPGASYRKMYIRKSVKPQPLIMDGSQSDSEVRLSTPVKVESTLQGSILPKIKTEVVLKSEPTGDVSNTLQETIKTLADESSNIVIKTEEIKKPATTPPPIIETPGVVITDQVYILTKQKVFALIRKPGIHDKEILQHLKSIEGGTGKMRDRLFDALVTEAGRFKRHKLITLFKDRFPSIEADC